MEDKKAIVTIISDDGDYYSGQNWAEIAKKYDIRVSVAGIVEWIIPHLSEWTGIIKGGHVELVNHSWTHLQLGRDDIDMYHETVDAKLFYEEKIGGRHDTFVFPFGAVSDDAIKALRESGVVACRGTRRGFNSLNPNDGNNPGEWFNLYCQGIKYDDVDDTVRDGWVDYTIDNNLWLIEMWHNLRRTPDSGFQTMLIDEAEHHLEYISKMAEKGYIDNLFFSDAVNRLRGVV